MKLRWIGYVALALIAACAAGYAAFLVSPWPSVLLIRYAFDKDSAERVRKLEALAPANVTELRDQQYGAAERARLDVFFPTPGAEGPMPLPAVIWIHGGAFIAGDKSDIAPYLKILAARGYTAVGVGYSLAPSARYPTPVKEAGAAIEYLLKNAARFRIDPDRLFLAGDSAGSQIAAQTAAIISNPAYAKTVGIEPPVRRVQLRGVVLFCGVYDASQIKADGAFSGFMRTVLWSYFGIQDASGDPRLAEFSVSQHITRLFPPAFISVGNDDPLGPQSLALAEAMRAQGVEIDTLFFPPDHKPPLAHEYQFNLDGQAGVMALDRLTAFLTARGR